MNNGIDETPSAGTDIQFSYALCNNVYQCFLEAGAFAGITKPDPSLLKNLNNWSTGKHKPTLTSLRRIPDFPQPFIKIAEELLQSDKQRGPKVTVSSMPLQWPAFHEWLFTNQELFFSAYALSTNEISFQILRTREIPQEAAILPDPYLRGLKLFIESPDAASAYLLRLESLIYIIAIREAGSEPCNRIITAVFNWRKRNPDYSYQEAFWKKYKMKRYTIWKHIAEQRLKAKPSLGRHQTTWKLERCYPRKSFYRRLDTGFDEPFLDDVFGLYHDRVLKRPADSETRGLVVYMLKRTVSLLHVLDWLMAKGRPEDVSDAEVAETIARLEYYMNYVIGYKDKHPLPESSCKFYDFIYDKWAETSSAPSADVSTDNK